MKIRVESNDGSIVPFDSEFVARKIAGRRKTPADALWAFGELLNGACGVVQDLFKEVPGARVWIELPDGGKLEVRPIPNVPH